MMISAAENSSNVKNSFPFFQDNSEDQSKGDKKKWKILIVDDEPDVHQMTKTILRNFTFNDRELDFYSAYNIPEAQKFLDEKPNIGLILLDVVMEEKNAGLQIVDYIRNELNNKLIRIILRTGQPGEAPEEEVIESYEINDYLEKGEITSRRLFTAITTSLRNYDNLLSLKSHVHELENLSKQLKTACDRLRILDEDKLKILNFLSHEIMTPLNHIGVSHLFNESNLSEKNKRYLEMVKAGFNRLSGLISSFLKYFEFMGSELDLNIQTVNLPNLIKQVLRDLNMEIIEKQLSVVQNFQAQNHNKIQSDPYYCAKILKIILENAIHFSKNHAIVEITVEQTENGKTRLVVKDKGRGIDQLNMDKVFNAFDLEEFHRNKSGYGLNLPIAKYIVDTLNAKIWLESEGLNKGTQVYLEF